MGRGLIADEIINQIRDRVDIVEVVGQHVALSKVGQNFRGLCPFHHEKTPSFHVSPSRQIFHCFGCKVGGNVFSFLMKMTGASFPEVVRQLGQQVGVVVPDPAGRGQDPHAANRVFLEKVNQAAAAWFQHNLWNTRPGKEAQAYLIGRGIQPEISERFGLGFAPPGWDALVKALTREGFNPGDLAVAGLAAARKPVLGNPGAGGYYDVFRARVMFPIRDQRKRVVGFGGRVLEGGTPKYLNSPDTPLFKKGQTLFGLDLAREAAGKSGSLVIVEGYFDVIALHQVGICNVVATLGTALTADHIQKIRPIVSKVVLLFDPDPAGVRAALRSLDLFVNSGIAVRVVSLPDGDDPDTFVRVRGAEAFLALQERAPSLLDFALEHCLKNAGSGTLEDRIRSVDDILRVLQKSTHPIEKEERFRVVAERLGISQQRLIERYPALLAREPKARWNGQAAQPRSSPVRPKINPEERDLVHFLLHGQLSPADVRRLRPELFLDQACRRIVESALKNLDGDGQVRLREVLDEVVDDAECGPLATELSLADQPYDDIQEYIRDCLAVLERKLAETRLRELIAQLKAAEREGRVEDVQALNAQVNEWRIRKAAVRSSAV